MKQNFKLDFLIILIGSLVMSCQFNYTEPIKYKNNFSDTLAYCLAQKTLKFIQENKVDSLKRLINQKVLNLTKPDKFDWLIREGKNVLDNFEYPHDTIVLKSKRTNYSVGGKQIVNMFCFPFKSKTHKDSIKYFHITILDNEIYGLLLNDYPPGRRIIEPRHSEPHKDKINMQIENLKWFRIWYDGGKYNSKKYKNEIGYYAVSGNKEKLTEIGVKDKFQTMFNLINNVKFDSVDFKYLREDEVGDPEWIYLRMRFDNEEYKNLGEFEISYFINEEQGKNEKMSDYIILKHTDKTRYFIRKDKNQDIVNILTEIAHFDYGDYYESYP